jgi:hypothetical protein
MRLAEEQNINLYNRPIEFGLRTLFILDIIYPMKIDLQRLIYYDYLILHSEDVEGGPPSIHPAYPHRSAEILVKREPLRKGLVLMKSRNIIEINFEKEGIFYSANNSTKPFLNLLKSEYSKSLLSVSNWVIERFGNFNSGELEKYISEHMDKWGGEFTKETFLRANSIDE